MLRETVGAMARGSTEGSAMNTPIVLGFDGTECAMSALDEAVELAKMSDEPRVVVVYGDRLPPGYRSHESAEDDSALTSYKGRVTAAVQPMLQAAADRIACAGASAETHIVWQDPARALLDAATENQARLIVIGTHGEGAVSGLLHGSLAYRLIHQSSVPVVVVPHRGH
jgi:nucleotide-binding universal stress UspA family protein